MSPADWERLLAQYGYAAVAVGTFFEGETILLIAGYLAHRGSLVLPYVMMCAFVGSFLGDQMFFALGRAYGRRVLARWPRWQHRVDRAMVLFGRWQTLFMLSFRFIYGLRTVSPFCLGMAPVSYRRFAVCNLVGAGIWAVAFGLAGWGAGEVTGHPGAGVRREDLTNLVLGAAVILAAVFFLHRRMKRRTGDG